MKLDPDSCLEIAMDALLGVAALIAVLLIMFFVANLI
jgi:hypothetical protein